MATLSRSRKAHRKPVPVTSVILTKESRRRIGMVIGSSAALTMIAGTSGAALNNQVGSDQKLDVARVTEDVKADLVANTEVRAGDIEWTSTDVAPAVSVEKKEEDVSKVEPVVKKNVPPVPRGGSAIGFGRQLIGTPYVYGGSSPSSGLDCSGFVSYVYRNALGINLPHQSGAIAARGRLISPAEARPGDVLHWPGHVGLYMGNGKVLHANWGVGVSIQNIWGHPTYHRF